jgi:hypothetical protein
MKRQVPPPFLLALGLLLLSSAAPAAAQSVPFQGGGTGQDQSVTLEPSGIHILSVCNGEASHLGRFTESIDYFLSYDLVHFAGIATFTAANGDEVFLTFEGTIPGYADQVFPLPFTATFDIVGGTGRFADAEGGGDLVGIDYGKGTFAFRFEGDLDY